MEYSNSLKGLNLDVNDLQKDGEYSFALNATVENFSEEQGFPFLSNTPSNFPCLTLEDNEVVLGTLSIHEWNKTILAIYNPVTELKKFVEINDKDIFITDNLLEEDNCQKIIERLPQEKIKQKDVCSSKELLSNTCFIWSLNNPINFEYQITDCTLNLYWNNCLDEDRFLYFDYDEDFKLTINNDFQFNGGIDCEPNYTSLDCSKTKWYPNIDYPCISVSGVNGNKDKGRYSYTVCYCTSKGTPLTPFNTISQPYSIYKLGQGLKLNLTNVTKNSRYKYILIVSIDTILGQNFYRKKAVLPITQTTFLDLDNEGLFISPEILVTKYPYYKSSCDMTISNNILFKSGLEEYEKFNLQPVINNVELEWVTTVDVEDNIYQQESYLRDEVYPFGCEPILDNGEQLPVFHIPSRIKNYDDSLIVDVTISDCVKDRVEKWEVYNTASKTFTNTKSVSELYNSCSCSEVYEAGEFAYWESSEKYPNNKLVWGDLCGQPIRHHKFPDHFITSHQSNNPSFNNKNYILPLGVRIKSNMNLIFDDAVTQNLITQEQRNRIVGYKLVRGNRDGNKSIIGKGILYDVWNYNKVPLKDDTFINDCGVTTDTIYFPNFPFNDLSPNKFLASNKNHYDVKNGTPTLLPFNKTNRYTFHSPDTHFTQPDLGTQLKIEAEIYGVSKGNFVKSENFAEYVLLSEKHYNVAKIFAQWISSTITSPTEEALSGISSELGLSIGGTIPGIPKIGNAIGSLIGGLIGTNIADNLFSESVFKNAMTTSQMEKILNLFKVSAQTRNYHYQYQAVGKYNQIQPIQNKIKNIKEIDYIDEGKLSIKEIKFNNAFRESAVYLELKDSLPNTLRLDNSRVTVEDISNSAIENIDYTTSFSSAKKFHITATNGRFRIDGILCLPYEFEGRLITSEPIGNGSVGNSDGEYNSHGLGGNFSLDIITECNYTEIRISEMDNILGIRSLDYGDLNVVVVEDCSNNCDKVTSSIVNHPCDCNKEVEKNIASYYVSNKKYIPNQYGSIYDIDYLDISNCITYLFQEKPKLKSNLIGSIGITQYCDNNCIPSVHSEYEYEYCENNVLRRRREKITNVFIDCSESITYTNWEELNNCSVPTYNQVFTTTCILPTYYSNVFTTDCISCIPGLIQLQVTYQCRNNGLEITVYPYNNCSNNPNDFQIDIVNSSNNGIIINRTSHNKYVIENNQPNNLTTHTDVTISGFGDSFTYDLWGNTCDHDNCPTECTQPLGSLVLDLWDGTNIQAHYVDNGNLLSWQTIYWNNENTQFLPNSFTFTGTKTGGSYVKLQSQPTQYDSGNCYCHGFNQLYLR